MNTLWQGTWHIGAAVDKTLFTLYGNNNRLVCLLKPW